MHLYFIGPRGSGKSTVATIIAGRLGWPLKSSDLEVQSDTGQTITQIFAEHGEANFRDSESKAIRYLASQQDSVIDLGGGAVIADTNRLIIRQTGKVVWLTADPGILLARIQQDPASSTNRPALTEFDPLTEMEILLATREPLYADCADYTVDTDNLTVEQVADRIVSWWQSVDKDCGAQS